MFLLTGTKKIIFISLGHKWHLAMFLIYKWVEVGDREFVF